jgi:hypothetical protein
MQYKTGQLVYDHQETHHASLSRVLCWFLFNLQVIFWSFLSDYSLSMITSNVLFASGILYIVSRFICYKNERNSPSLLLLVNVFLFSLSICHYYWVQGLIITDSSVIRDISNGDVIGAIENLSLFQQKGIYAIKNTGYLMQTAYIWIAFSLCGWFNLYSVLLLHFGFLLISVVLFRRIAENYFETNYGYLSFPVLFFGFYPGILTLGAALFKDSIVLTLFVISIYYLSTTENKNDRCSARLLMFGLIIGFALRPIYAVSVGIVVAFTGVSSQKKAVSLAAISCIMLVYYLIFHPDLSGLFSSQAIFTKMTHDFRSFSEQSITKGLFLAPFIERWYTLPLQILAVYVAPFPQFNLSNVSNIGETLSALVNVFILPLVAVGIKHHFIKDRLGRYSWIFMIQMMFLILTLISIEGLVSQRYQLSIVPIYILLALRGAKVIGLYSGVALYIIYFGLLMGAYTLYILYKLSVI